MTSLYMVITNFDDTATTDSDISFNYGTSLNPNGNINLTGTLPSAPGVSNFYSGVSFPNDLPGIDQTIGDVYLCFGGTSMETINNSNRIEGKMLKGSETNTTRKFAFTSPNIHSNLGSSLGQFGSCVSAGVDYDFYDKNLGGLPYRVRIETTPKIANWVAVGQSDVPEGTNGKDSPYTNILFSVDGISWQSTTTGASFARLGVGVAYDGTGRWVAVGDNNTPGVTVTGTGSPYGNILYSDDGLSWKPSTTGSSFLVTGLGVAYGGGKWVAVGDNLPLPGTGVTGGTSYGNILHSTDGISWKPSNTGASFSSFGLGVAYGGGKWVAVGANDTGYGNILHSTDGISWKPSNTGSSFLLTGSGVAYDGIGTWVAVGDNATDAGGTFYGNILHSTDGISWKPSNTGVSFAGSGNGVAYGGGKWVAVGDNKTPSSLGTGSPYGNILHSTDGIIWQPSNTGASFLHSGQHVAYSSTQNRWVAVGDNNAGLNGTSFGNILYSTNGISWYQTTEFSAFSIRGGGVAFKN